MEKDNLNIKRSLVIQSFAPLFLLLAIKHSNICLYWKLARKFFDEFSNHGVDTIITVLQHSAFGGLVVFVLSITWLVVTLIIALGFKGIQNSGFKSAGEQIVIVDGENEGSAIFLVTYVLPLLTDDVQTWRGLLVFIVMLILIIALLINSKTFYKNPILPLLNYKIYSFTFINPDKDIEHPKKEYVCITHGKGIATGATIKRKYISDGIFLIFNN